MTQPSALEQLINAKVDERLAKVTTPYILQMQMVISLDSKILILIQ